MKKYEITIMVDTNDGDYLTEISEITEEELNIIKPLIEAIKNFKPYSGESKSDCLYTHTHNYTQGEYGRKDLGEKTPRELYNFPDEVFNTFEDLCPYGEYGFHTVESILLSPTIKKTKLL